MYGNSAYLTNKGKNRMKHIKDILEKMRATASRTPDSKYSDIWLQRSTKDEDGTYVNQNTNVETLKSDTSDKFIYNLWARISDDGLKEMDDFVETELIPNGMFLLNSEKHQTEKVSGDGQSVRYMIARNLS